MEKIRFTFQVKAGGADGKTNIITVISFTTEDGKTFLIPEDHQPAGFHKEVIKTTIYTQVKNSLKKRHQIRSVWIPVTQEIKSTYFDENENAQFQNEYLELKEERDVASGSSDIMEILKKLTEIQSNKPTNNVKKAAEKFVLEKYDSSRANAVQWMTFFEKECERFEIIEDKQKIEIFRLFLEKNCLDWYSSMMMKNTLDSNWSKWKKDFLDTYSDKGWSASRYALSFKYQTGPLLEYAIKKEKLLLEVRRTIDKGFLIDAICGRFTKFCNRKN